MRIDPNNWLKQAILSNSDLMNTLLLKDLSQKLKCFHTEFYLCHNHAALYQGGFHHRAFMVDVSKALCLALSHVPQELIAENVRLRLVELLAHSSCPVQIAALLPLGNIVNGDNLFAPRIIADIMNYSRMSENHRIHKIILKPP